MSYWDTSALVKLHLVEPDSAQFESLALAAPVVIGMIARYEMLTVFHRREAEAAIPAGEATALYQHMTSDAASGVLRLQLDSDDVEREFGTVLERCFSQTPPLFIRTAMHCNSLRRGRPVRRNLSRRTCGSGRRHNYWASSCCHDSRNRYLGNSMPAHLHQMPNANVSSITFESEILGLTRMALS